MDFLQVLDLHAVGYVRIDVNLEKIGKWKVSCDSIVTFHKFSEADLVLHARMFCSLLHSVAAAFQGGMFSDFDGG